MTIAISGNGTITGIAANGLPSGIITSTQIASGTITSTQISSGSRLYTTNMPAGSIVQTVVFRSQINVTMTTNSYADTGYAASITPTSSSNKILFTFSMTEARSRGDVGGNFQVLRNGSQVAEIKEIGYSGGGGGTQTTGTIGLVPCFSFVDLPASTSALSYQVYARKLTANAGQFELLPNSANSGWVTILLQEIAV